MATEQPRYEFEVEMTCEGCSNAVRRVLGKLNGVSTVEIDFDKQRVYVNSALKSDELMEYIKKTGKACKFIGTV